jgi:peptide chain release factor 1
MVPQEKLDQICARFEFVEAKLNAGPAQAELAPLSREYAELRDVVASIEAYRGLQRERAEAEAMLADPEMRGLAEDELARLRPALAEAEQAVRLALLPKDAADDRPAILEIGPAPAATRPRSSPPTSRGCTSASPSAAAGAGR